MSRAARVVLCALLLIGLSAPLAAYLKLGFQSGDRMVTLRWSGLPMRYFVTNRGVSGVTAAQFQTAVAAAYATWDAVPTATFSGTFAGFTSAAPFVDDGMSVLGFEFSPELDRVLAATTFIVNTITGEIVESDIFFNSAFPWSTASGGETGRFDLQSVALHEIGHLLGLGHSAIGETELVSSGGRRVIASETVMFPIAFSAGSISEREPRADDIAGVSDIYPAGDFRSRTGSVSGRVTKGGSGVFGAHVVAFNLRTGALTGNFSLNEAGNFTIAGLEPGPHVVRVEPLDDGDIRSFFSSGTVDTNFTPAFFERLVVAPRGGAAPPIEIRVNPR
jgi:hypothetical protein